jgi:hypothetical protein
MPIIMMYKQAYQFFFRVWFLSLEISEFIAVKLERMDNTEIGN